LNQAWNQPVLAVLGFGGGILHVLNHAVFKSLLFLGAGAVVHSTGTRDIDRLGGLFKTMKWTGVTFLVASAAISGLPPFNGFVSEFLIYIGAFSGVQAGSPWTVILAIGVTGSLALIGGLAAACFAKAFGVVFLGEPRSPQAVGVHEAGAAMRWPMAILAAACLGIGLLAPAIVKIVLPAVHVVCSVPARASTETPYGVTANGAVTAAMGSLTAIVYASASLLVLVIVLFLVRRYLPRGREETVTGTWDCGYARPSPRMQYTASSFAQPLTDLLKILLGTRKHGTSPQGFFPQPTTFV
jgi:formate hydrogenlyase subunit 3/multisubunit Na+/H+ antiporter MnhD subunit